MSYVTNDSLVCDSLKEGDVVFITKGKHQGKSAFFVKRTKCKVAIKFFDDSQAVSCYLDPDRVNKAASNISTAILSVGKNSSAVNYEAVSRSTAISSGIASSEFSPNSRVYVTGGKYKGKYGNVVAQKKIMVGVRLDTDPLNEINLLPTHLKIVVHRESKEEVLPTMATTIHTLPIKTANFDNDAQSVSTLSSYHTSHFDSAQDTDWSFVEHVISEPLLKSAPNRANKLRMPQLNEKIVFDISSTNNKFATKNIVQSSVSKVKITGGEHVGKTGVLVKNTPKRVAVRLDSDPTSKPRYFKSENVVLLDNDAKNCDNTKANAQSGSLSSQPNDTLLSSIYGPLLHTKEYNIKELFSKCFKLEATINLPANNGKQDELRACHLISVRISSSQQQLTAFYIDYNEDNDSIQDSLNRLANFGALSSKKAVSRLELLTSTGTITDLSAYDFEVVPDFANEGCGFIPQNMLNKVCDSEITKQVFAVQVRILAPRLGLFKGMLVLKEDIDKIQLPLSMRKVEHSVTSSSSWAKLLVTETFPSWTCINQYKLMQGKTSEFKSKELSEMIVMLLKAQGVPESVVCKYNNEYQRLPSQHYHHSHLVGVADPTRRIPPGYIFIPGFNTLTNATKVLITRYPVTEAADGLMLPLLRERPLGMAPIEWDNLNSFGFGLVIFGNPYKGCASTPSQINEGDLDGDIYFVCWDETILSHATSRFSYNGNLPVKLEDESTASSADVRIDQNYWLRHAQQKMLNYEGIAFNQKLIGHLYYLWKQHTLNNKPEALYFGRAYKDAINSNKHDIKVTLPSSLWQSVDPQFHKYLT